MSLATQSNNINHESTEAARNWLQSEIVDLNKAKNYSLFLPDPTRKKENSLNKHTPKKSLLHTTHDFSEENPTSLFEIAHFSEMLGADPVFKLRFREP